MSWTRRLVAVTLVAVLAGAPALACGSDDSGGDAAVSTTAVPAEGECPPTDGSAERTIDFASTPTGCIDPSKSYTATFDTTEGSFTVGLDTKRTPKTVDTFAALSGWKYYDGTKIFRTERDTGIAQGGAPHTDGADDPGPGFVIEDEGGTFTPDDYGPGALAFGRSQAPDSASGGFFLISGEEGRYLGDPALVGPGAGTYVVFGKVTDGLDVLKRITDLQGGVDPTTGMGTPSRDIVVESVTIAEQK